MLTYNCFDLQIKNIGSNLHKHWVAGTTMQVVDRKTDKIITKKTIYAFT